MMQIQFYMDKLTLSKQDMKDRDTLSTHLVYIYCLFIPYNNNANDNKQHKSELHTTQGDASAGVQLISRLINQILNFNLQLDAIFFKFFIGASS